MLYQWIRVLYSDNGTLSDMSIDNQDESSDIAAYMVTGEDYIYLAQQFPFNNFFIQSKVANDVAATMAIEYWDGTAWQSAVDVLDATRSAGCSLAKSGVVQFSPHSSYRWNIIDDTTTNHAPTELSTVTIYNMYWLRFSFNATLKSTTSIDRIAYAFTRSQQVDNIDTTINGYLTTFATGKTNWDNEIITASIQMVNDMRGRGIIVAPGQILRFDDVSMACDWRTLMLIYNNLGGDYSKKYIAAEAEYKNSLSLSRFTFDKNEDAFVSRGEITNTVIQMVR